jgi:hypothetical protein
MNMKDKLVIIASVRNPDVISDYAKNMAAHKFDKDETLFMILTEDFVDKSTYTSKLKDSGLEGMVLNQRDRDKILKENRLEKYAKLIPKRTHAETSFGLMYMLLHEEFKYGFFIDDDTAPAPKFNYFKSHIDKLNYKGRVEEVRSDKGWVNVLYQCFKRRGLYPRGYPYSKMGEHTSVSSTKINKPVYISQGLWTNIPDLDAIRILMDGNLDGRSKTRLAVSDYKGNFVVGKRNFLTVCSMNLAFRREIIPAFYQMRMDDNPYHISRFDDIWSGCIAKKVLDGAGGHIMSGFPLCIHNKAPRSTFKDISFEAPGYESNEYFSESLRNIKTDGDDIRNAAQKIADTLSSKGKTPFIKYCAKDFGEWLKMCDKVGSA